MRAPGHVNTTHNADPLSRRLPTMRSLLRYQCIVAAAFAPPMPSSYHAISKYCFTFVIKEGGGSRGRV